MMIFRQKIRLLLACLVLLPAAAAAQYGSLDQYKGEIGLAGGVAFYLGDANPNTPFHTPRQSLGGFFRYNVNSHYSIKISVLHNKVVGDTRDFRNRFPEGREAAFERKFMDLSARAEFNFFRYGLPSYNRECKWFSPYIFVGIGLTSYNDDYRDRHRLTVNIPYGIGVKFKFKERFNAGVEWSLHTLFVDDFDVAGEDSEMLDNPFHADYPRTKGNDKYSIATAFISIDIFRKGYCH